MKTLIDNLKEAIATNPWGLLGKDTSCNEKTPKSDLCGELDSCEYCYNLFNEVDLADLHNDNLNER